MLTPGESHHCGGQRSDWSCQEYLLWVFHREQEGLVLWLTGGGQDCPHPHCSCLLVVSSASFLHTEQVVLFCPARHTRSPGDKRTDGLVNSSRYRSNNSRNNMKFSHVFVRMKSENRGDPTSSWAPSLGYRLSNTLAPWKTTNTTISHFANSNSMWDWLNTTGAASFDCQLRVQNVVQWNANKF